MILTTWLDARRHRRPALPGSSDHWPNTSRVCSTAELGVTCSSSRPLVPPHSRGPRAWLGHSGNVLADGGHGGCSRRLDLGAEPINLNGQIGRDLPGMFFTARALTSSTSSAR